MQNIFKGDTFTDCDFEHASKRYCRSVAKWLIAQGVDAAHTDLRRYANPLCHVDWQCILELLIEKGAGADKIVRKLPRSSSRHCSVYGILGHC